jgi:hypothetical protein
MNLANLGFSYWIIILNILLFVLLLIQIYRPYTEMYTNYPQQVDPEAPIISTPEEEDANNSYASILMFLKNNPSKSVNFISDIKRKFFNNSCTVKDDIDFNNIMNFSEGKMPF